MEIDMLPPAVYPQPSNLVFPILAPRDRPGDIRIDTRAVSAFLQLYKGMRESASNGTGYSPRVAKAMADLKLLVTDDLLDALHD
jgi:hypothetical protein